MDYSIEIVGKDTPQLHRQLYRVAMKTMRRILIPVLCFMVLGYLILALDTKGREDISMLCASAAMLLVCWFMPQWMGYLSFRKKLKYYNGNLPDNVIRFGEQIRLQDVDSSHVIPYDKIKKITFTEECIVLHLQDGRSFGLPKGPFTKGSLREMMALLKEKCPQLKLPDWQ